MKSRQVSATWSICRYVAAVSTPETMLGVRGRREVYMKSSSREMLDGAKVSGRDTVMSRSPLPLRPWSNTRWEYSE